MNPAELMLLGFLSLLLTVGTKYVAKICVPKKIGYKMLPCKEKYNNGADKSKDGGGNGNGIDDEGENRRKLLSLAEEIIFRRVLAGASSESGSTCKQVYNYMDDFFLFTCNYCLIYEIVN